jgi:tetratricopeptide (TPR) repeat protein
MVVPSRRCLLGLMVLPALVLLASPGCSPRNGEAVLEAGMARLQQGQFESAAQLLEKAVRRQPQSATAHCNLGIAYWELGEVTRALASLGRAAELARNDPRPLELLGQVFTRLERWEEARRTLADAQALDPGSARVMTSRAVVEFRAGEPAAAEALLSRALKMDPNYAPALYNMAQVQRYLPDGKAAAGTYFERFLDAATHEDRHTTAAQRFLTPSSDAPRNAVLDDLPPGTPGPSPAEPLLIAARDAIAAGDYTTALISLKEAVRTDPAFADAQWALVQLYDKNIDDPTRAAELYTDFIARFPADERTATARLRSEDLAAATRRPALASIAGTAGVDQAAVAAAYQKAIAAHRAADWPTAIQEYRTVLSHDAGNVASALNLGQASKAMGDLVGAEEAFAYALAKDGVSSDAAYGLASVMRERGKLAEARSVASRALARDPNHPRMHHLMGLILLAQGEEAEARKHFQRYVELAPDEPVARRLRDWLDSH